MNMLIWTSFILIILKIKNKIAEDKDALRWMWEEWEKRSLCRRVNKKGAAWQIIHYQGGGWFQKGDSDHFKGGSDFCLH